MRPAPLPRLFDREVRHLHCVGVGGMGVAPLAIYLAQLGYTVSGEDDALTGPVRELLGPIDNPRYLLARRRIWRIFREDYFALPEILARKKEFAEMFAKKWRRAVGPIELVYTRTAEGRRLLLRARIHSLAGAFQKRGKRVSCWK